MLLCAALAAGESRIRRHHPESGHAGHAWTASAPWEGPADRRGRRPVSPASAALSGPMGRYPCRESGSTLRFCIPAALLSGGRAVFTGAPRLLERGVGIYEELLRPRGVTVAKTPESVTFSGRLTAGSYTLRGDVSSQFVTGSAAGAAAAAGGQYAPRSAAGGEPALHRHHAGHHGVLRCHRRWSGNEISFISPAGSGTRSRCAAVEGDWSNAAFLLALGGGVTRQRSASRTACRATACAGRCCRRLEHPGAVLRPVRLPRSRAGAVCRCGASAAGLCFTGTRRLRIKESDRAAAMAQELAKFGAQRDSGGRPRDGAAPAASHAPT